MDIYVHFVQKYRGLQGEVSIADKFPVSMVQHKYRQYVNFQHMGGESALSFDDYKSLFVLVRLPREATVPIILEHELVKKLVSMKYVRVEDSVNNFNGKHLIALHSLRQHLSRTRFLG